MADISTKGFKNIALDLITNAIEIKNTTGIDVFVVYNPDVNTGHQTINVTIYEIGYIYQSSPDFKVTLTTQLPEDFERDYKKLKDKIWEISQ